MTALADWLSTGTCRRPEPGCAPAAGARAPAASTDATEHGLLSQPFGRAAPTALPADDPLAGGARRGWLLGAIASGIAEDERRPRTGALPPLPSHAPLVGLCGPSGAGKSSLAEQVAAALGGRVVRQDEFLLPEEERRRPGLLGKYDLLEMERVLWRLLRGRTATFRPYDTVSRTRAPRPVRLRPGRAVVVEGVTTMLSPLVRRVGAVAVYVDAPPLVRVQRQIERRRRDGSYRGLSEEQFRQRAIDKLASEDGLIEAQRCLCGWILETAPATRLRPVAPSGECSPAA